MKLIKNPTPHQLKMREYNREWRRKNAVKDKAWHKAYYAKHRKRLRPQMNAYRKNYYRQFPEKTAEYRFKKKYGLTLTDIGRLKKKQQGKCAICRKRKRLNVDHCHKTGKVRGLLCTSCNTALGAFSDSPKVVRKALTYLEAA